MRWLKTTCPLNVLLNEVRVLRAVFAARRGACRREVGRWLAVHLCTCAAETPASAGHPFLGERRSGDATAC